MVQPKLSLKNNADGDQPQPLVHHQHNGDGEGPQPLVHHQYNGDGDGPQPLVHHQQQRAVVKTCKPSLPLFGTPPLLLQL